MTFAHRIRRNMLVLVLTLALAGLVSPLATPLGLSATPRTHSCAAGDPRLQQQVERCRGRLHERARIATLDGSYTDAATWYQIAIDWAGADAESYLRAALLYAKTGEIERARNAFSSGVVLNREDATLLQAWGLFESKNGEEKRALRLLRCKETARTPQQSRPGLLLPPPATRHAGPQVNTPPRFPHARTGELLCLIRRSLACSGGAASGRRFLALLAIKSQIAACAVFWEADPSRDAERQLCSAESLSTARPPTNHLLRVPYMYVLHVRPTDLFLL